MQTNNHISKAAVYFIFVVSILAWEMAIALVILLAAQGYTGFDSSSVITATCTANYFIKKESALTQMLQTAFVGSLVALVIYTVVFIIMLLWTIRVCKDDSPNAALTRPARVGTYVLSNIAILAAIPPCGYYMTHLVELSNCTSTYNQTQIIIIFVIALLLLVFSLIFWVLMLRIICKDDHSEEKYREDFSHPTQPQERPLQHYRPQQSLYRQNSPPKRAANQVQEIEHTKQNLFESPSHKPNLYIYKEKESQVYGQFNEINRHQSNKRSIQESEINSKYVPQESSHQISPPKRVEPQPIKQRSRKYLGDEEEFAFQQNRFMSKYQGGSILPSRGVEEKQPNQRRQTGDYFATGEPKRRFNNSPGQKLERQEAIMNQIRSKYGN